jgi:hypothetical protein
MKKYIIGIVSILLFSSCGFFEQQTEVEFTIEPWYYTDEGERYDVAEVAIISSFNNWGGSSFTAQATWDNATPMTYSASRNLFVLVEELTVGEEYEYSFMARYTNGGELGAPLWENPGVLYDADIEFTPMDRLADNGVGNGGENVVFTAE